MLTLIIVRMTNNLSDMFCERWLLIHPVTLKKRSR